MKAIWGTDGSSAAEAVLQYLLGPLNRPDLELVLTVAAPRPMVAPERPDPARLLWHLVPGYRDHVSDAITELVEQETSKLQGLRGSVTSAVRLESPAAGIVGVAREQEADLVAVGGRGHSEVYDFLLGSVARQVMLYAPCSVLVARRERVPGRVLLAWDGSADQGAALDLLRDFEGCGAMELRLLHAIEPIRAPERLLEAWTRRGGAGLDDLEAAQREDATTGMRQTAADLERAGWGRVDLDTRRGRADEIVLDEAERFGADLIVLGARGEGGDHPRMLMGGVSDRVALHARASVLVTRVPRPVEPAT